MSTCTGYLCPGLSGYVVERLGLPRDVRAFDLVGHGCAAALPNWQLADALLESGRCRNVVSVCVELSSAAMYLDDDPGVLISACLFGDGAGAAVLGAATAGAISRPIECGAIGSLLNPSEREALRFEQRGGMLRNVLTRPVPRLAAEHAEQVLDRMLAEADLERADIAQWVWHAGGRDVLLAIKNRLKLSDEQLEHSSAVLREFGNLSSAFVYFVLEAALAAKRSPRLVVDVVVRRGLQLPRRAAGGGMSETLPPLAADDFPRRVTPEILDELPASDPRARRSRARPAAHQPDHGRGDLAQARAQRTAADRPRTRSSSSVRATGRSRYGSRAASASAWLGTHLTLLDLEPIVAQKTADAIRAGGWTLEVVAARRARLARARPDRTESASCSRICSCITSRASASTRLLGGIAARADAFVCCEPRRSRFALAGSRLLGLIGCNDVTRHDAVVSVQAGFRDGEIGAAWRGAVAGGWALTESAAGAFSHLFVARRDG